VSSISEIAASRELIVNLTLRELRSRYKKSTLGWLWSLLNPLSTVLIYTFVFTTVFGAQAPIGNPSKLANYTAFFVCGLIPWNFFANTVNGSMSALIANAGLIKKVYFPREDFVLSFVASMAITFAIEMLIVGVVMTLAGNNILKFIPLVLLIMIIQGIFITGIGLALSVLNAYFRDVQYLVGTVLIQLLFYMTPIIYQAELIKGKVSPGVYRIYSLNPLMRFTDMYRDTLYHLRAPTLVNWIYTSVCAVVSLVLGMWIFRRNEGRLAEEL
jgi:ABC-type polysaccharide/polyol phosphate export permease